MQLIKFICFAFLLNIPVQVWAEVTRIDVRSSGYLGNYNDYEYHWVDAFMYGKVVRKDATVGQYKVPVNLIFPTNKAPRAGFVDLINSASFAMYHENEAPEGRRVVYRLGEVVLGDSLRLQGYSYLSLQWAKMVTEIKGESYGIIEDGRDGYEIINDAARYLKAPVNFSNTELNPPAAVEHVVSFGFSQTAKLQYSMVSAGLNREADGSVIYDGMLAGAMGAGRTCVELTNSDVIDDPPWPQNPVFNKWGTPCEEDLPADTKYISLMTQSDVIFFKGHLDRQKNSHYRQYELAGISHIPPDNIDFRLHGSERQNPISLKPAFRAVFRNLDQWVLNDVEPPPSRYIEVDISDKKNTQYVADKDGNVLGGVRFPHMLRNIGDEPAGAPLGIYGGIDTNMGIAFGGQGFSHLGGTFEPFAVEDLKNRYVSPDNYLLRIEKSLDALVDERFLLPEDKHTYLSEAKLVSTKLFQ